MNSEGAQPYISVCIITYNQEKYIRQTLDSILMQKSSHTFEMVIGEDMSTDDTRKICEEYQNKHPSVIRLLPSDKNYGMMGNFIRTLNSASGKYIAFCEGDDFWSDEYKLQRQVDFLDNNDDYVLVSHNYGRLLPSNTIEPVDRRPANKHSFTVDDYIMSHFIHLNTLMYKRTVPVPDWFHGLSVGDQPLIIYVGQQGKIGYIPASMSVYRINSDSFMNTKKLSGIIKNFIRDLGIMNEKTGYRHDESFKRRIRIEELMHSFCTQNYFEKQITLFRNLFFLIKYRKYIFSEWFAIYKLMIPAALKNAVKRISQ